MIRVNETDYLVGLWMVKRFGLGKVYVYATKCIQSNCPDTIWTICKKFIYENQSYNIYMSDNDYKNNNLHKNKSELEIIKICNDISQELALIFTHEQKKILIGGDFNKYNDIKKENDWLPNIIIYPVKKSKKSI